jgi:hypothetical protein
VNGLLAIFTGAFLYFHVPTAHGKWNYEFLQIFWGVVLAGVFVVE